MRELAKKVGAFVIKTIIFILADLLVVAIFMFLLGKPQTATSQHFAMRSFAFFSLPALGYAIYSNNMTIKGRFFSFLKGFVTFYLLSVLCAVTVGLTFAFVIKRQVFNVVTFQIVNLVPKIATFLPPILGFYITFSSIRKEQFKNNFYMKFPGKPHVKEGKKQWQMLARR